LEICAAASYAVINSQLRASRPDILNPVNFI
jgi:hypothetical protein